MNSIRVLNIDDDEDDSYLIKSALTDANYDVEWVRVDTEDAIRSALEKENWDLIISDYLLPGFSGVDALEIVKEADLDVPFIVISGTIDQETAVDTMRHGASDYLMKGDLVRLAPAVARELQEAANRRDKRDAEKELERSEARLQLALRAAGMGAWERDLVTHDVFWSPETSSILGSTVGGAKLTDVHPNFVEEDREHVRRKYKEAVETGQPITLRLRVRRPDGEIIWVTESAQCEYDEKGTPLRLVGTIRDITRDKMAEDALIEAEERYRVIAETASDAVISIDESSRIIFANPAAETVFGYTRSELIGQPLSILQPGDLSDSHLKGLQRYVSTGQRGVDWRRVETKAIKKDGTQIDIQISFGAYSRHDKHVFTAFVRDVTEQRLNEDALRDSEHRYRELFESNPYPMWVYDVETLRFVAVNDAAVFRYGYSMEEFLAMKITDIRPPEDVAAVIEKAKSTQDRIDSSGRWRHKKKNGELINVEITSHALEFEGRRSRLVLAHDITDRVNGEYALRRSEAKYRELFENANDVVYTHDLNGRFTSLNRTGERVTGYTEAEILKMNVADFVAPEFLELAKRMLTRRVEGSPPAIYETEIIARDGRRVPLEINARFIFDNGDTVGVQGIGRDISERVAAQEALRTSEEQLRQSQKLESIGILAGGMAHDFNNMLTAINGYSDLILRKIAPDDPIRRNVIEIKKAGERSADLTRQLLAFSRRQILQPRVIDLNETIVDTTSMLRRLIGEDVQIETKLTEKLLKIEADPNQLTQVLMNLAINARDAMPSGGTLLIESSNVELDEAYASRHIDVAAGRFVMLAVSDTGIGMDEATRRRVFEPFFTTKSVGQGTGLGLSTVYGIVKQSGGNIWVYSEPGRGTTFKIYLPEADPTAAAPDFEISQRELHIGSETILLVEDERAVRGLAKEILESCGYTVIEASDGVEALEKFEPVSGQVDVLITDVIMPRMGGRELSELLKAQQPDIKVLFTSGYTDDAILRHGITDEGTNFLQKPFTYDSLSRKVRALLDGEFA